MSGGKSPISAQEAFALNERSGEGEPLTQTTKFLCPYNNFRTFAVQHWGTVVQVKQRTANAGATSRRYVQKPFVVTARCEACDRESIFVDGQLVVPFESEAPEPAQDIPQDVLPDFLEAREIVRKSPRGASALLRLAIQKLLPHLGATKKGIDAGIAELVAAGKVDTRIQQALDTVRVIGNEAVHPGELDLRDDISTALMIFRLENLIVEKAITEPRKIEEMYASLPRAKLDGIAQRDKKKDN